MASSSDEQPLVGVVRLVTTSNVFVTLEGGGEVRVAPEDFKYIEIKEGLRVLVYRKLGTPQSFNGGPNATFYSLA